MFDEELAALLRTDFQSFLAMALETIEPAERFVPSWHLLTVQHYLERAEAGKERRIIFNLPPRSLKSVTISVAWVAFLLARDPSLKIIVVSNTEELARRHATSFRRLVNAPWYRAIAPKFELAAAGDRIEEQRTTLNGYRYAASVNSSITGQGADIIIIDDPNKAQDVSSEVKRNTVNEYYSGTLYSRLTNKAEGVIVLVQQRLHANDLSGFLLEAGGWTHVCVPIRAPRDARYPISGTRSYHRRAGEILQPERNTIEVIEEVRGTMGSFNFEAQYQQNPVPPDGQIIKKAWLRYSDTRPDEFDFKLVSWDTASTVSQTADYSVGTVWGRKARQFYLIDVVRERLEPALLSRRIEQMDLEHEADATIIEDTELGRAFVSEMRHSTSIRPILFKTRGIDKDSRLEAQAPKFEAGQVVLPQHAPWLGTFVSELLAFPSVAHNDQVDSVSQALSYLSRHMERVPRTEASQDRRLSRPRPQGKIGRGRQPA
jgi:predicted phage terminase large subunit-like protein